MQSKSPVGVIVSAVVIFVASFLPWGSFDVTPDFGSPGEAFGEAFPFQDMKMTFTLTGWYGELNLLGMKLPNWLAVISGLSVGVLAVLGACSVFRAHPAVNIGLCGYGLFHAGFLSIIFLLNSSEASLGVGALITVASFVTMLVLLVLELTADRQPPSRNTRSHQRPRATVSAP